ncbi:glycoside hydrolase family 127 protein [Asticcacaulis sp. ZE23SCel15]|uniref:beta-L-arabinofuranosidase domain-containing protein n=1 Tax=Asticcacaulis sp. ZE23SCel15 TaxID=3059027 RepID=UPI00265D6476|nr:beta-L-arabinofuranosidase domain-containing protein [Asticcacaulis sp. ZE23SCel15]WKL56707.1 glycoside hydrolase family 127 protein [Asticcacaulis sp. ZE23SCel15]
MTSRRTFLHTGSSALCACAIPVSAPTAQRRFPKSRPKLTPPAYGQVRLSEGRLKTQLTHQHDLFMGIDNDRLLKPFRVRAGQDAPGEDMGGWYDASDDFHIDPTDWSTANWHGYIPGHSFGQYMSGLARSYAITGDGATQAKVASMVRDFIPTISPSFFDGYPLPAYTYDKIVIGMVDAYRYAGVTEAKTALDLTTDAVLPYLPEKALTREERRARPYTQEAEIWDEPYILPEHLFQAWKLGMGDRYRDLAVRFLQNEALFEPLAAGVSPLKGKHAYSHVNALNSAIEAWYATNDIKYLKAAINGFDFVERQSYATGGWGPNEELVGADDTETLYTMLTDTHRTFETPCGAYGHFKITRSLLGITKDSRYGDSMERVLYNTILGAKPTEPNGDTFYYSDYSHTATKFFRGEAWPCCSGTFIQVAADYGISAYLLETNSLYVNLYVASQLTTQFSGETISVTQVTDYPLTNTSRIEINPAKDTGFKLYLRIPAWSGPATRVAVNGKPAAHIAAGKFLNIERIWQKGDVVEITFEMGLRLEPLNAAHPEMVAVMTGPLTLFPINAPETPLPRETWLKATRSTPDSWSVATIAGAITLKPFIAITNETYRLYNPLSV